MSNIFEIDGEIEDNFDENGDDKNAGKDNNDIESKDSLPIEDANESTGEGDAEIVSEENGDDEPWYNKYLPDEENKDNTDSNAEQETEEEDQGSAPVFEIENDTQSEEPVVEQGGIEELSEEDDDNDFDEMPTVDDITQDEIDEVLAEIDEGEKELDHSSYDTAPDDEEEIMAQEQEPRKKEEESFSEIFPPKNRKPVPIGTWTFLVLFLISLTLLSYYQFYNGESFSLDFTHKSEGSLTRLDSVTTEYAAQVKQLEDQQKIIKDLRDKIQELHAANIELAEDTASSTNVLNADGSPAQSGVDLNNGTYYQVQLIALQQYHPSFGNSEIAFYIDKEDGFSKMLMGAFSQEDAAKVLYQKVKRSGFNDAFIVKKVNGKRVEYNPFEK